MLHTSSEVTVRSNTIKFKCYGERLEPNLKEMTKVKKMIINKSLYLSVKGSSTRVLIGDTFQIELEFRNVRF